MHNTPPSRQIRQSYSSPHSPDQIAQPSGASGQDLNTARPRQDNAAAPKPEPIGTWAHRQIRFPWPRKTAQLFDSAGSHSDAVAAESGSPSAVSNPTKIPGSPVVGSHPQPPLAGSEKPPPAPRLVSIDEDDAKVCADVAHNSLSYSKLYQQSLLGSHALSASDIVIRPGCFLPCPSKYCMQGIQQGIDPEP